MHRDVGGCDHYVTHANHMMRLKPRMERPAGNKPHALHKTRITGIGLHRKARLWGAKRASKLEFGKCNRV